jgi:hypothetical protein
MAVDSTSVSGEFQVTLSPGIYHQHFSKTGYNAGSLTDIYVFADSTIYVSITLGLLGSCEYLLGDINSDGQCLVGDVTFGVRFFKGTAVNRPIVVIWIRHRLTCMSVAMLMATANFGVRISPDWWRISRVRRP